MAKIIIDTTSGDEIKGRIGRFAVTHYHRNEATEGGALGIFEGIKAPVGARLVSSGKQSLLAALTGADAHNDGQNYSFDQVVSLYDSGTKTWWPVAVKDVE